MGICRGMQVINIALGGSVYQDLQTEYASLKMQHAQKAPGFLPTHHVTLKKHTWLAKSLGQQVFVNSRHHQAVKKLGQGLIVSAQAPDGVIEGIETTNGQIIGVQWHPEDLYNQQPTAQKLFKAFLNRGTFVSHAITPKPLQA